MVFLKTRSWSTMGRSGILSRSWPTLAVAIILAQCCCLDDPVDFTEPNRYRSQFELLWETFDREYIGFIFVDVDWEASYSRYSEMADTVTCRGGLVSVLTEMLSPLEDGHIYLYEPSGGYHYPCSIAYHQNYDMGVLWNNYLVEPDSFWVVDEVWGGCALGDSIPYVMFTYWDDSYYIGDLDDFLDRFPNAPAAIFDIRMNDGGDITAAKFGAREFCTDHVTGFYKIYREGPEHDDLSPPRAYKVERYYKAWERPVALLVGERCQSTAEAFACMMDQMPQVTIIGDTTRGQVNELSGESMHQLGDYVYYWTPDWTIATASDTSWVQGVGVPPHIFVQATEEDFEAGVDPVLDYALQWAGEQARGR
ncbi:hypothetical protein GF402_00115 [Candidatus Fermentibacteria bacterium]|nr:hypothetical protein [Candidatus Fermentibacteria bacterium]